MSDAATHFDILTSDEQNVLNVNFVSDEMVEMNWKFKKDFIETSERTNVVVAAYTTVQACLKPYGYLEMIGSKMLYADTDAIIFKVKPRQFCKESVLGNYLDDLTNEEPDGKVNHFVTEGPKIMHTKLRRAMA